jgi:hypothetical protein
MKAKPNVKQQVEWLKQMILAGEETKVINKGFLEKWPDCTQRQYEARIIRVNREMRAFQNAITEKVNEYVNLELSTHVRRILSVVERKEILTQIALGQLTITKPINVAGKAEYVQCEPDYTDRIKAIAELNRIDGSYQPIRADITTNGQSITPVTTTIIQFNGVDVPLLQ